MRLLYGEPVAEAIGEELKIEVSKLKRMGVSPLLNIISFQENEIDRSYETGILKAAAYTGVEVSITRLGTDAGRQLWKEVIFKANMDKSVHGILLYCPLPEDLKEKDREIRDSILTEKDVDGLNSFSLSHLYLGDGEGFSPCTAEACMEILHYYGIPVSGKNVVVLGRSLIIGRPLSMLLLRENATVTICHSKSERIEEIANKADILISATGQKKIVTESFVNKDQTVIDVGINYDPESCTIMGDVDFETIKNIVDAVTPVPKGVGSVTSMVLMKHVIRAACMQAEH